MLFLIDFNGVIISWKLTSTDVEFLDVLLKKYPYK
jgi:hypothetical protein